MPTPSRVTLRDIAARLGISHVTVSLALKNHPRISQKRRKQVQALAEEMGYQPDPMLSSLIAYRHSKRTIPIHSAIAWINHWDKPDALRQIHEFDMYWQGASEAAARFGYRLEEFVWNPDMTPKRMETILLTRQIRGVLIPPHPSQPDWGDFHWDNFSVIRFGLSIKSPASHIVTSDQMQGIALATKTIFNYGYRRIGFVGGEEFDRHIGGNHVAGFQAAQRMLQMETKLHPLLLASDSKKARTALKTWIASQKPDALLTTQNGLTALLHELGIRIPDDIALASSSISDIRDIDAGLDQNSQEIGRVAVETVISLINANDPGRPLIPRRILVASSWKDGSSMPLKNRG
jgi:DNA-binding LacI/PurR family transcriptional regulator